MVRLCYYGCGREAKHYFPTVDRWCCEANVMACPKIRQKNSKSRIGNGGQKPTFNKDSIHICEYGCGNIAKWVFKNGRWCCSRSTTSCPEIKRRNSTTNINNPNDYWIDRKRGPQSKEHKRKIGIGNKGCTPWNTGIQQPLKQVKERSIRNRFTIKQIQELYPIFASVEEMRYNPDKPGEKERQFHCKYNRCQNSKEKGGWFTPTEEQFRSRRDALEHDDGNDGCYLYCTNECKQKCTLFNLRSDPYRNTEKPYTDVEYGVWRKEVFKRDNYECIGYDGHYCGKPVEHAHHIHPVKTHPELALDPDNGISLCKGCHKYIHRAGTPCSTGNLASRIC